jgi:hypothetical protein
MAEGGQSSTASVWITHVRKVKAAAHVIPDDFFELLTSFVLGLIINPSMQVKAIMEQEMDSITCFRGRFGNLTMVIMIAFAVREMMIDISTNPEHRQFWINNISEQIMGFVKTVCARGVVMIDWMDDFVMRKIREILRDAATSILLAGHGVLVDLPEATFRFKIMDERLKKSVAETIRGMVACLVLNPRAIENRPDFVFALIPPVVMRHIKELAVDFKSFIDGHWERNKVNYYSALSSTNL